MEPTKLITDLAQMGVLGLLLAISLVANVWLYKEIRGIQEKRIQDIKDLQATYMEPIKAIQQTVNLILSAISKGNVV